MPDRDREIKMTEPVETLAQNPEAALVDSSGLFDRDWYLARYPEAGGREDTLVHFCRDGWRNGFQPNPYFDPAWYARTYGSEFFPGEHPLMHYIRRGERENAWPSPLFDPEWYRDELALDSHKSPLRHYLSNRGSGLLSPLPGFDVAAYVKENPRCLESPGDPYLHWRQRLPDQEEPLPIAQSPLAIVLEVVGGNLETGSIPDTVPWEAFKQALRLYIPNIPFDEAWYCRRYPDVAAAVKCGLISSAQAHFIDYGYFEGRIPAPPGHAPEQA